MPIKYRRFENFQLWQTKVGSDSYAQESEGLCLLGESEVFRLRGITNPRRKREYILSRALIRYALSQVFSYPVDYWILTECSNAPPSVKNLPTPVFFSLSHSDSNIYFVLAKRPIGIDVELIKPRDNIHALAQQFMHANELIQLEEAADELFFYRTWSAKEAYFKALTPEVQASMVMSEVLIASVLNEEAWYQVDFSDQQFSRVVVARR
ncbi:hypothetical protein FX988_02321 [Paraglaciecola mesophila]|uniref:4'-phosphopantetheinyl transferase domain-containing protein n=1 Tax=Paraglaciecola mesophila TaxID=197222 RepID=A0A857JJ67_9ALTE|nr:4'-phosphopantetheinyl transferase superfamily protein [Paraglaciecola mesophila]QHJ12075.1 hypothetical protein FX988_02321 [Paraglaciecola mesophila]